MALTLNDIALACLSYLQDGDAALASATTQQKAWIARDINAALDEARHINPAAFRTRHASFLEPPATVTGSGSFLSNNYVTVASAPGWATPGQTILFEGRFFRTYDRDGTKWYITPRPYDLNIWSGSITWYCDAVEMASDAEVGGPVLLEDDTELIAAGSWDRMRRLAYRYGSPTETAGIDYGMRVSDTGTDDYQVVAGEPGFWCSEIGQYQMAIAGAYIWSRSMLMVAPVPSQAYSLSYYLGQNFREVASSDLSSTSIVIEFPGGAGSGGALLLPLVLARWAAAPWCRLDSAVREQLNASAATARAALGRIRATGGTSEIISGY